MGAWRESEIDGGIQGVSQEMRCGYGSRTMLLIPVCRYVSIYLVTTIDTVCNLRLPPV